MFYWLVLVDSLCWFSVVLVGIQSVLSCLSWGAFLGARVIFDDFLVAFLSRFLLLSFMDAKEALSKNSSQKGLKGSQRRKLLVGGAL